MALTMLCPRLALLPLFLAFGLVQLGALSALPAQEASPADRSSARGESGGELRILVSDGAGRPAAGARVRILPQRDPALASLGHGLPLRAELEESAGWAARVELANGRGLARARIDRGRLYRVQAELADGSEVSSLRSDLRPGDTLRIATLPASSMELHVGERAFRYTLHALDRDVREEFILRTGIVRAAEAVRGYSFPTLAPGTYRLWIVDEGAYAADLRFTLRPRERRVLRPALRAPASVRAQVIDDAGQPIGVHRISLPPILELPGTAPEGAVRKVPALDLVMRLGLHGEDGSLLFRELGPLRSGDEYPLRVPSHSSREASFALPAQSRGLLVLAWRDGGRLTWRSERVGQAAESSNAPGEQPGEASTPGSDSASDSEQRLRLRGLPKSELLLLYWGANGERLVQPWLADAPSELALEPEAGSSVDFAIRLPDGRPARGARVLLYPVRLENCGPLTDLHPPVLRYTNTRGQVRFPSLAAGRWQLRVQQELFVPEERILDIAKGQRLERQITLERGMRLHGKVLRPDGSPASGALLILSDQTVSGSSIVRETSAEADGSFRFTGLPRGYYLIEARRSFGIHSELARKRGLRPGPEPIELRLRDEDPPLPGTRR
jgi:hypothetical protein